jgi:PIN domain nuclease of toxin-antitoxin system
MTDRLLLDTCTCSWLMRGDRMSAPSLQAIGEAQASRSGICVSAITAWEVATLVRKGRYRLLVPPKVWFNRLLALVGVRLAELTPEIRIESTGLPSKRPADPPARSDHHGDRAAPGPCSDESRSAADRLWRPGLRSHPDVLSDMPEPTSFGFPAP